MYCTQCIYLYNALAYAYILCSNKTTSSYTRDAARDNAKSLLAFHWVRGHNENFFFYELPFVQKKSKLSSTK